MTKIKKTNEIASEEVLSWSRKVKVPRAQKALIQVTNDNKEFNAINMHEQENNARDRKEICNNCK